PRFARAKNLAVEVSFEPKPNGAAGMLLSFLLSPRPIDVNLGLRLTTLAKQSATLRAVRHGGQKLALSAAWQLALALGGHPSIRTTTDRKVRVKISLPLLPTASLVPGNNTRQASVASNGESGQPANPLTSDGGNILKSLDGNT